MKFLKIAFVIPLALLLMVPPAALAEGEDDPLWNRPSFEKKVIDVGQRILAANGITERIPFVVTGDNDRNAYAKRWGTPNEIGITQGMLNVISSDDELAAVLAHEIAHITRRHARKKALAGAPLAAVLAGLAAYGNNPGMANYYGTYGGVAAPAFAPNFYSRKLETEADLVGLDYMVKAGYNPLAMETMFAKFEADGPGIMWWFSTHPMGKRRLAKIHETIMQKYPQFLTPDLANNPLPGSPYQLMQPPASGEIKETASAEKHAEKPEDNPLYGQLKQIAETGSSTPDAGKSPSAVPEEPAGSETTGKATATASAADSAEGSGKSAPAAPGSTGQAPLAAFPQKPERINYQAAFPTGKPVPSAPPATAALPTTPTAAPAAAPVSIAQVMLTLKPEQLRVLQLLCREQFLNDDRIRQEFSTLAPEAWNILAADLEQKHLIRRLGNPPETIYVLTESAQRALAPAR